MAVGLSQSVAINALGFAIEIGKTSAAHCSKAEEAPRGSRSSFPVLVLASLPNAGLDISIVRFIVPCCHLPYTPKYFGIYGGDDGARTRDLCRDRAAL